MAVSQTSRQSGSSATAATRAFLLGSRLHPAGAHLDEPLLDGLLEDRLEEPVRVGLLGGRRPHLGVPGGDLRGGDLGQRPLRERGKDGQSEELRIKRRWDAIQQANDEMEEAKLKGENYIPFRYHNGDTRKELLIRGQ